MLLCQGLSQVLGLGLEEGSYLVIQKTEGPVRDSFTSFTHVAHSLLSAYCVPGIALETRIHSSGQNTQKSFWWGMDIFQIITQCIVIKRNEPNEENFLRRPSLGFYTQLSHHSAARAK